MPTKLLAENFPKDVQEKLKPRLDSLSMSPKRVLGWVILVLFIIAYIGLFVFGGIDGLRNGFTFHRFFLRFLTIGAVIKAFDIICLDFFLLTKTHFFQYYFPETEGCPGWQEFGYNRKQQERQCVMIVIGSILMPVFSRCCNGRRWQGIKMSAGINAILSAVRAIKAAYARDGAGGKMHMHIEPGMMHCYASAPVFRESRRDFNKQIALLRQM